MSRYVFKVPDLGEGTVSSEIVAWRAKVGDVIREDEPLVEMSTEKAVVEVPSPVAGRIVVLNGGPGDVVAVGAELAVFETDEAAGASTAAPPAPAAAGAAAPKAVAASVAVAAPSEVPTGPARRVMASPATRRRASEAGINLAAVPGSGPGGRIERTDLEAVLGGATAPAAPAATAARGRTPRSGVEELKVIGVRRVIAERMSAAKRNIPHFSYVEEIDVTELESLRSYVNSKLPKGIAGYTYLPFLVAALTRVLEAFPQCNAHYDAERNVILRHAAVHVGIATQTPDGLKVPVVRHAESLSLGALAAAIRRVSEAARNGKATRAELGGSTITVTSLGKLGGIVSTPVINAPEVAIIGVNKAIERPVVVGGAVAVRRIMNLSSSFDHRFVDGFDAAAMIQALKERLEHPATIFIDD
jgi:2-oxoisovalerate dehydrogenase E2 component (dihydrolipoyl transacylase)